MNYTIGNNLRVTIFGQSHSPAIGVVVDGLPSGFRPDWEGARALLKRRAPGGVLASKRAEADEFEVLSGLYNGATCGAPLACAIRNTDARAEDYAQIINTPRPGHADYAAHAKYAQYRDARGGGQFSGRMTAPLCLAGALAMQLLARYNVSIGAHALQIGNARDRAFDALNPEISALIDAPIRTLDERAAAEMALLIDKTRAQNDSLGGVIECAAAGLRAGVGEPMFDGLESAISRMVFAIPAIKGIEFGAGFGAAHMRGSENNDEYMVSGGRVLAKTNHAGGILGGVSNGMPIIFRAAVKPTPSIALEQRTVDLESMRDTVISIQGRHDPCVVPRAVACVEAACALALCDLLMEHTRSV